MILKQYNPQQSLGTVKLNNGTLAYRVTQEPNPYEAYGHHTDYGIEEQESYARIANKNNTKGAN